MIIGFSTSCAWSSVAAWDTESNELIWSGRELAPQAASGACLSLLERMLAESAVRLEDAELFAADLGPGSFTGVRVGVTLAKTFAFLYSSSVSGLSSFDLLSNDQTVVMPSKKGEYFIRRPGTEPIRSSDLPWEPFVGFGPGIENEIFPDAGAFGLLASMLVPCDAAQFVPLYLIEPSISIPKKPFPAGATNVA